MGPTREGVGGFDRAFAARPRSDLDQWRLNVALLAGQPEQLPMNSVPAKIAITRHLPSVINLTRDTIRQYCPQKGDPPTSGHNSPKHGGTDQNVPWQRFLRSTAFIAAVFWAP